MRIITGFHAIEEELRSLSKTKALGGVKIVHSKPGPRVKKILEEAKTLGIPTATAGEADLDRMAAPLPPTARDHRGIILVKEGEEQPQKASLDESIAALANRENALVLVLDSITDPHNVGAVIRSADQFSADLVIIPENRGAADFGVISRTSAGAASWVNVALTNNLVRAVERLKEAGFWVYGADAGGESAPDTEIAAKAVLVMGSEGTGIARLLREKCDRILSIPTTGRLDSLNVSVAAGILLYEFRRQNPLPKD